MGGLPDPDAQAEDGEPWIRAQSENPMGPPSGGNAASRAIAGNGQGEPGELRTVSIGIYRDMQVQREVLREAAADTDTVRMVAATMVATGS